jgi:hypothetical protein
LLVSLPVANQNGWQDGRSYRYRVPSGEARQLTARAMRHGKSWAVRIDDLAASVASNRASDLQAIREGFVPASYVRESFAGRKAARLDPVRLESLKKFVEDSRRALEIPGVAIGIIQDGRTLFSGGFGVREIGKPGAVDADTLFWARAHSWKSSREIDSSVPC